MWRTLKSCTKAHWSLWNPGKKVSLFRKCVKICSFFVWDASSDVPYLFPSLWVSLFTLIQLLPLQGFRSHFVVYRRPFLLLYNREGDHVIRMAIRSQEFKIQYTEEQVGLSQCACVCLFSVRRAPRKIFWPFILHMIRFWNFLLSLSLLSFSLSLLSFASRGAWCGFNMYLHCSLAIVPSYCRL